MKPLRIDRKTAAKLLGISVSTLKRRCASDPIFPKPYKDGQSRSAHIYFSTSEIEQYIKNQFPQSHEAEN